MPAVESGGGAKVSPAPCVSFAALQITAQNDL